MNKTAEPAEQAPASFYEARQKIYPREIEGRYTRLQRISLTVLLGIYYLLPWLQYEGRQAVLFDLPARKFYIFGITFWPQDFFYMAWLLIMAALTLFFFTAIAGRVWCGFACPQTIWTEAFLWMERLAEGSHTRRRKLDQGPWNGEKLLRKGAKHFMWIVFALWTGITFVGYFSPIRELFGQIATFSLGPWTTFWCLFYSLATYGNAGLLREQVCKYMCPYARFQSAMFDKDTLIISYDAGRGEPRGGRKRKADPKAAGLGDCIDCNMCVQVCPTGIDIREGLQYECIACAACVDVCNSVMDRMEYPRGLIRYTSEHALEENKPLRVFRPRTLIYGSLLIALFVAFFASIGSRTPLQLDVIRDRNSLYRELPNGDIENVYSLKILNLDTRAHTYTLRLEGAPGMTLETDGGEITLEAGDVQRVAARIRADRESLAGGARDVDVVIETRSEPPISVRTTARFVGPPPGR
jgi:cytochrome c oxidase accessory protein FixG